MYNIFMSNADYVSDLATTPRVITVREPSPREFDVSDLPGLGPMRPRHMGEENWYFITAAGVHGFVKLG